VSGIAAASDIVSQSVLPPLLTAADVLTPAELRPSGSRIDVEKLRRTQPHLDQALASITLARGSISDGAWLLPQVRQGVQEADRSLRQLMGVTRSATRATRLLPPMLGTGGVRRYLVAIQNPAESRGTGGLIGAYGVLEARDGSLRLLRLGPNSDLRNASRLPLDLGENYHSLYGDDPAIWLNSNLSPHFPYAAQIWLALWRLQFSEQLDGVIATDAVALGYLVAAAPSLEPVKGVRLTGETTADFLTRGIYERFPEPSQNDLRDRFLTRIGAVAVRGLLRTDTDARELLKGTIRAVAEGRLAVFSNHPAEQAILRQTRAGRLLPRENRAFVSVVVNNGARNKLDVYLDRTVRYTLGPCVRGKRNTRIEIALTNVSPSGLPAYVVGDFKDGSTRDDPPVGTNRLLVYVFVTPGAALTGATLDGEPLDVRFGTERRHPVFLFQLDLPPHRVRRTVLELVEPAGVDPPQIAEQPLVRSQRSVIRASICSD